MPHELVSVYLSHEVKGTKQKKNGKREEKKHNAKTHIEWKN